ncbi:DUF2796 domain-containing protein [Vibrio cholerae]
MNTFTPIALGMTLAFSTTTFAEETFRQHDAHVHGQVEFNIAQDGKELLIEITAPGADVVGFEHAPNTDEQKETLSRAVTTLNDASTIFTLASQANCRLEHRSVSHTLGEEGHDDHGHDSHDHDSHDHDKHDHDSHDHDSHDHDKHDHDSHDHESHDHDKHDHDSHDHDSHDHDKHDHDSHDHESHGGHGEFTIEYHYECDNIQALSNIDTQWFNHFPSTEAISVNLLTDQTQAALKLGQGQTRIAF